MTVGTSGPGRSGSGPRGFRTSPWPRLVHPHHQTAEQVRSPLPTSSGSHFPLPRPRGSSQVQAQLRDPASSLPPPPTRGMRAFRDLKGLEEPWLRGTWTMGGWVAGGVGPPGDVERVSAIPRPLVKGRQRRQTPSPASPGLRLVAALLLLTDPVWHVPVNACLFLSWESQVKSQRESMALTAGRCFSDIFHLQTVEA